MHNEHVRIHLSNLANTLGPLKERFVLTGGVMVSFYLTDPQESSPRVTKDVDVIVDVATPHQFREDIESIMRQLQFTNGTPGDPICRWRRDDFVIDIMPANGAILGFSNQWYMDGFKNACLINITSNCQWKALQIHYYFASKIEAFFQRGIHDPALSPDLEDIISIVNGRTELVEEVRSSPQKVRSFIHESISELLTNDTVIEAIPGLVLPDSASQQRIPIILSRLKALSNN